MGQKIQLTLHCGDFLPRQTIPKAQCPPADHGAGIIFFCGEMPGAPLEIGFYLLSIQIGIPVLDDAVLHEQGGAAGDKGGGHGGAGVPRIASAGGGAENIYPWCGDIWLGEGETGISLSGKRGKSIGIAVVGSHCDRGGGSGRDGKSGVFDGYEKSCVWIDGVSRRQPEIVASIYYVFRYQLEFPDTPLDISVSGYRQHLQVDLLGRAVGGGFSQIPEKMGGVQDVFMDPRSPGGEENIISTGGQQADTEGVNVIFPDLKIQGGFTGSYSKFNLGGLGGVEDSRGMPAFVAFISAADADGRPAQPGEIIDVGFQKGGAVVASVTVTETDIHGQGQLPFHGSADAVLHPQHEFRCAGKALWECISQFYDKEAAGGSHAFLSALAGSSVAGGDPGYVGAMTRKIAAGKAAVVLCQGAVDVLAGEDPAAVKKRLGFIGDGLIPEFPDPGGTVLIAEIRVEDIDATVHDPHQYAAAIQRQGGILHRGDAGGGAGFIKGKNKIFWFFNIFDLWHFRECGDIIFWYGDDGIASKQWKKGNKVWEDGGTRVFYDQFPAFCGRIIPNIQGITLFSLGFICRKCQFQYGFKFLIGHWTFSS